MKENNPKKRNDLQWWEIKDSDGNYLRQPPEWDKLDDEMEQETIDILNDV